jgi:cell division protein ZapA (FtsZ GTPase activity inhibitor)
MTNDARFDDIYTRLNELTEDVTNLKIQAGTIGTSQVAIARTLTLATGLASDMHSCKADIRKMKADIRNLNPSVEEILRLLASSLHKERI